MPVNNPFIQFCNVVKAHLPTNYRFYFLAILLLLQYSLLYTIAGNGSSVSVLSGCIKPHTQQDCQSMSFTAKAHRLTPMFSAYGKYCVRTEGLDSRFRTSSPTNGKIFDCSKLIHP